MKRACSIIAVFAAAWVLVLLAWLVGRPIATEDFWWHLKMGEVYFTQGLWPAHEPLIHTSTAAPIQHEWLFEVAVHLVNVAFGLFAVRVGHVIAVAAIIVLVVKLAFDATRSVIGCALVTVVFAVLAQSRLMQLRPDLPTIFCCFAVYWLTWSRSLRSPTQRGGLGYQGRLASAAAVGLMLFWANVHSLFAIGLILLAAATVGAFVEDRARAKALGLTTVAAFVATLLNPRGIDQHLTFFTSSKSAAIWSIVDDWVPFDPFRRPASPLLSTLDWLTMDAVLVAFGLSFAALYLRYRKEPSLQTLEALSPTLFLPAAAAVSAPFISFRFMWVALLPMLYAARAVVHLRPRPKVAQLAGAVATASIAAVFAPFSGWQNYMGDVPPLRDGYFTEAYNEYRYPDPGVFFLKEAGLTGNLYNHYSLGGYFDFRLAPTIKPFIDGRTEHYSPQVKADYHLIMNAAQAERLELLDRYQVDLFFGFGGKYTGYKGRQDTLALMNNAPGWSLVFRSYDHSISLRNTARNAANFARVKQYYAQRGIAFDETEGLRVSRVLRDAPEFALRERLIGPGYAMAVSRLNDASAPVAARITAGRTLLSVYRELNDDDDAAAVEATISTLAAP